MTANVCRALLTVFLALCLLSGATASDEFSDALIQDVCVECGSADGHLESCSLYVIPDIIDDSFDTDIPDIVEEPLNPEFSGDDLSSSDAVSSGDDSSSSDLLTESTEPPVQLSFAEQLLASDDLWGMYSKMLSAMNEDVGILYALTADELVVLKEHANLLYLSIPETTSEDMKNRDDIIATLTVLEESISGTPAAAAVYEMGSASSKTTIKGDEYICFDLAAGKVEITASTYTGSVFEGDSAVPVTGDHLAENNYYVYQSNPSNKATTGLVDGRLVLPTYERVGAPADSGKAGWGDYITNNTDVEGIISNWTTEAKKVGRESTPNWISVTGSETYNITIDNLWSSKYGSGTGRTDGGLSFNPSSGGKLTVNLVGDNRFTTINYIANTGLNAEIIFNASSDNADSTLTVASNGENFYNSAIGGSDSSQNSDGIVFNGGIIFAGTTVWDDCTAIGGGGNGVGDVTINGGVVTAVSTSSGAAIGGGIGESSPGGTGYVKITGGEVYAYNFGYVSAKSSGGPEFIPSAAIGGGSSRDSSGSIGEVTISGGTVYAQSLGGTAIGGGSSTKNKGGDAKVTISNNARVTAVSVTGTAHGRVENTEREISDPGAGIGGGTAGTLGSGMSGGSATLTVSDTAVLKTGSIGGGKSNNPTGGTIGSAKVTINGGTIIGQVIMEGTGSTFTMTGGTIDNANSAEYNFLQENGGAVWIQTGDAKMSGGTIKNTNAVKGGAIYVNGGSFAMSGGNISSTSATANGGAIYVSGGSVSISGGNITDVSAEEGGAVYVAVIDVVSDGDSFTMSGGTIQNATATEGSGGAVAVANGKASMKGGSIKESSASLNGGAVSVSGGSFAMSGGSIDEVSALNGGAVAVSDGTFTMSAGTIQNSEAIRSDSDDTSGNGGAVSVSGAGSVLMSGGSLDSCSAYNGGGVYVNVTDASSNSFTMNNSAEIRNCTASSNGGAVCVEGGNALMKSGSIDGGSSLRNAVFGGAVYVKGGSFTMENGVISNSRAGEDGGAVCVEDGSASMLSGTINSSTANDNGGAVSVNGGNFLMSGGLIGGTSDADKCSAAYGGGVSVTGGTFTMNQTSLIAFCNATANGGGVYVNVTGASDNSFTMDDTASIKSCTASSNGGAVCVEGGHALMISGSIDGGSSLRNAVFGGAVYVKGGSFTMADGVISNNRAGKNGGAVCVEDGSASMLSGTINSSTATENGGAVSVNGGSFLLSGGLIGGTSDSDKCSAAYGGGVSVTGGTFTMNLTSRIAFCNATANGGGVYVKVGAASDDDGFTMSDTAAILNCTASGNGGAVCVEGGSASMLSGTINSSTASDNGGAVSVSGGSFIMSGGTIGAQDAGCSAENGGAVSVTGGTFTMSNSRIQNCTATAFGGGVYVRANKGSIGDSFIITDSTIESCEGKDGGAISVSEGSVNMTYGSLLYCNATQHGGGLYVSGGNFNMRTGSLLYCNATANGGAAYLTGGNFDMDAGIISHSGAKNGGAVYVSNGNFDMFSGTVTYNTAQENGGAVYVYGGNIVIGKEECEGKDTTHSHPDTKNNYAGTYGGALAVSSGTVILHCGNVTDNSAGSSGDTIHQTGGTITVNGGSIGTGVAVIGSDSKYIDNRGLSRTIYFNTTTPSQKDIPDTVVQHTGVTASNLILNKNKIEDARTEVTIPEGKYVIGWTNNKSWESGESYWPEGSEVPITQEEGAEIRYYAIWGDSVPSPNYVVVIPETLTLSSDGTGSAGIGVSTFEHVPNIGSVAVTLSAFTGNLTLNENSEKLAYTLSVGENKLELNEQVTAFTYESDDDVILTAKVTEDARFSGEYSETLTFALGYSVRAYSEDSY
ncbi:MAG: hypothetical protein IJA20_07520 [Methanocorpusculum sp.]|nr:hypothetical protein [Methanocorpusculum sp.]